jgi:UDP-N-acetylglucosamine/UDP-N-acetylgalactosamine diphosphorylase
MAGGTGPRDHSEVGSSFIHFNYTPNQDKATASLIGDVPRGVMLNQRPIFLGGQGGLVGPIRVAYGVVTAAGSIVRKDLKKPDVLVLDHPSITKSIPFQQGLYNNVKRIVSQNTIYIANLIALRRWYLDIRSLFLSGDPLSRALHEGAVDKIQDGIRERVKRFGQVADSMERSIEMTRGINGAKNSERLIKNQEALARHWNEMVAVFEEALSREGDPGKRNPFIDMLSKHMGMGGRDYVTVIRALDAREAETGASWLQELVDGICRDVWNCTPEMEINHG